MVCPTGALREQSALKKVTDALMRKDKHVVVQHAPAVSVALGEQLGLAPGADVNGMMVAALRQLGFDKVFDTAFSADLTIMEEASELAARIANGGKLPMMTSCCPGWIKFVEQFYPEFMGNLSTCKSPQQMLGAVIKNYYAKKAGLKPEDIYSVSVMPCSAKKFEAQRPEMANENVADVDAVLTTRALARMIKRQGLDITKLKADAADTPFGKRSTAGKLFGATGGVMEAAIRTAYYLLTGEELADLEVKPVRGLDGVKSAHLKINDMEIGVAVVYGLGNARKLLSAIKDGSRNDIHFVEVMACPGGCIGGGGQPRYGDMGVVQKRMEALYDIDKKGTIRVSHKNPDITRIYDEFLGEPLGETSHHLLHTHYESREVC
jgi:NADH-quinone oxidoreductase subunit G/NADP-reducing hydrogenase subunit HndD